MSSRTNLKLQLQREQAQRDDDRRGNGVSFSSSTGSLSSTSTDGFAGHPYSPAQHRGSPLMRNPNNSPSMSMSSTVPSSSEFQQHYNMSLQSQSRLEHPNRFFGDDKPRTPMKTYVSNSMGRASPLTLGNSLPNQLSMANLRQHSLNNTASPLTPDSPMTPRSVGTPHSPAITDVSEMDELIEDIMELEAKSGSKNSRNGRSYAPKEQLAKAMKSTSPLPANLTGNTDYLRMLDPVTGKLMPSVSSSCPANLLTVSVKSESFTEDDVKSMSKDRQKKDNHNIIERKRRDNINNLIKELRTMLPHSSDPDFPRSKGSTLKATVDYLKELKKDRERLKILEERQKAYELQNRKLAMKVQELERLVEVHGIQLPLNNVDVTGMASLAPHLSALITGKGSPQPDSYPGTPTHQQPQSHHFPSQNQYVQIKQEPAQSPIPQAFPQYMSMSLPEEFVGVNFSVTELANMMDTTEMDPMVSSLTNPFENFNMSEAQHLDMDFLT